MKLSDLEARNFIDVFAYLTRGNGDKELQDLRMQLLARPPDQRAAQDQQQNIDNAIYAVKRKVQALP